MKGIDTAMTITLTTEQAIEIAKAVGIDPNAKRELTLDSTEIEKIWNLSQLNPQSHVELIFNDSGLTASLIASNVTIDITNYNNLL